VKILKGGEKFDNDDNDNDCITATFILESCKWFFHQHDFTTCAVVQDSITPNDIWACVENQLPKAFSSTAIAKQARYPLKESLRPVDSVIIVEAAKCLSMSDPKHLLDTLIGINNHFGANDDTVLAATVSKRWEHFIDDQCVDEERKDALVKETR
jgi:hypothetical protein